jgi:NADH-quinone oxidoreductase subunit H
MTAYLQSTFLGEYGGYLVANIALILLIVVPLMLTIAMIVYAERKLWAAFSLRRGPNVVGPFGVFQLFADALKSFLQETIIPSAANKGLFLIAPIITFAVAQIAWAVIPFGPERMLSDINVGLLYILAVSSLGVYGVIIAGWASNSKYPFYAALRAAAQMVSYEVSIGFILISVVLWSGSFNLSVIVEMQRSHLWITNGYGFNPLFFPMAVMFFISSLAETARAPFDLTEAESELVAGYQTEYSSMSYALFWLGEYSNMLLMCGLNTILFWGGYLPPIDWAPLYDVPGIIWLFAKMLVFFFLFAWVKSTVPRYRYDQLMRLGWKVFLPISLLWVVLVSGYLMVTRYGPANAERTAETLAFGALRGTNLERHYRCGLTGVHGPDDWSELILTEKWRAGSNEGVSFQIEKPNGKSVVATQFEIKAIEQPIGGQVGLSWPSGGGGSFNAKIVWSDVVGNDGPQGYMTLSNTDVPTVSSGPCLPVAREKKIEGKSE